MVLDGAVSIFKDAGCSYHLWKPVFWRGGYTTKICCFCGHFLCFVKFENNCFSSALIVYLFAYLCRSDPVVLDGAVSIFKDAGCSYHLWKPVFWRGGYTTKICCFCGHFLCFVKFENNCFSSAYYSFAYLPIYVDQTLWFLTALSAFSRIQVVHITSGNLFSGGEATQPRFVAFVVIFCVLSSFKFSLLFQCLLIVCLIAYDVDQTLWLWRCQHFQGSRLYILPLETCFLEGRHATKIC